MVTIRRCDNCAAEGANSAEIKISVMPPRGKFGAPTVRFLSCDLCDKCYEKAAKYFKQREPEEVIEPSTAEVAANKAESEALSVLTRRLARNNP